jgi:type VI secretion system protein ImpE
MTPHQLLDSGNLREALLALSTEVRDNPMDHARRSFLFDLLCFSGEFDRAAKHLEILSQQNQAAMLGTLLYHTALHAEQLRQETFAKKGLAGFDPATGSNGNLTSGSWNGESFDEFADSDPRIGKRLEVFAAGSYLWVPLDHIESVEMRAPRYLRDLLWAPAVLKTGPAFKVRDLGEVFLPVLSPFSWKHAEDSVRLGRMTVWVEDSSGEAIPFGQKIFLADDREVPILETRLLTFTRPAEGS